MESTIQIFGHCGGFQPGNTLFAFKQAKEHNLDGVELDVWLTRDKQLAVLHGSNDGQLPNITSQEEQAHDELLNEGPLISDLTLAEVRAHFAQTQQMADRLALVGEENAEMVSIPTLEQVFECVGDGLIINIEVKLPKSKEKYELQKPLIPDLIEQLEKVLTSK